MVGERGSSSVELKVVPLVAEKGACSVDLTVDRMAGLLDVWDAMLVAPKAGQLDSWVVQLVGR